jgi:integrase
MGRKWRKYSVGPYSLGRLNGEAVVTWRGKEGKRHRYRLDVFTEDEGRAALDRFARQNIALDAREAKTMAEIWERYLADRELDGKQTATMQYHWKALKGRFGLLSPDDIDADICRDYAKGRLDQGKSVGTAWTELTQLRSILNWAKKRKVIKDTPYVWVPSKPDAKERVLDRIEVESLLDACFAPHVRLFVILALTTAGRSEAILELKWTKVDFIAGTIDLRSTDPRNPLLKVSKKGRALVPMNDLARAALQEAQRGAITEYVIEWDGEGVDSIRKGFQAAVDRAGLNPPGLSEADKVTPHTLRHTANTWMQEADIPPEMRARYLGHKRVETNQRNYSHAGAEYLQPAAKVVNLNIVRKVKE